MDAEGGGINGKLGGREERGMVWYGMPYHWYGMVCRYYGSWVRGKSTMAALIDLAE